MAEILNGDILRVRIYNEVVTRTQKSTGTMYYRVTAVSGVWQPLDVANVLSSTHGSLFRPWQALPAKYNGTGVAVYAPMAQPEALSTIGTGTGTAGAALHPTQVTGLIGMKSGRYHTGSKTPKHPLGEKILGMARMYVSFPASFATPTNDGRMAVAQYNQLVTIMGTLYQSRGLSAAGGLTMTIVPKIRVRVADTFPVVDPPLPAVVTFEDPGLIYASNLWATQRRRGDRGQHEAFAL